jgi:hypothetical protein
VNNEKLCESAYLATKDQDDHCQIHGAGMVVRTATGNHVYLVRGSSSDSVVHVLHRQLIRAGRLPKNAGNGYRKLSRRVGNADLDKTPKKNKHKRRGTASLGTPLLVTLFMGMVVILWSWLHE